jgi:exopolysaccharide biosynthesis polyprenyl glycosylphosphotransferase
MVMQGETAPLTEAIRSKRGIAVSERRALLAITDAICVVVAFALAFNVWTGVVRHSGFALPRFGAIAFLVVWFVAAWLSGVYDVRSMISLRRTTEAVVGSLTISLVGLIGLFFAVPYRVTRPTILIWVPAAAILILLMRALARLLLGNVALATPTVMICRPSALEDLQSDLVKALHPFYSIVGVVDPSSPEAPAQLAELVQRLPSAQIVVGLQGEMAPELFTTLITCHEKGMAVRSLADVYEELTGRALLDQLGNAWLMSLPMRSQTSRPYAAMKRLVDVLAGLSAMVVLALLFIPLALAIRLTSRGPIFHSQERVGKYGKPFRIVKLRTMRISNSLRWTERSDGRVTFVGGIMRKLHVDELPQGWNIVRGDMSIVGPRPEQPHYVEQLREHIGFYNSRLVVRPGLTGWAQVNHGYSGGIGGARIKLSYDLYYIRNQSFSLDLLILVRTLFTIAALRGL